MSNLVDNKFEDIQRIGNRVKKSESISNKNKSITN